jgi:hypothetical protein
MQPKTSAFAFVDNVRSYGLDSLSPKHVGPRKGPKGSRFHRTIGLVAWPRQPLKVAGASVFQGGNLALLARLMSR